VSVLTPTYNSELYLRDCIESVLAQDHPEVEHIVQDGASTDGTLDILQEYSGRIDWASEPDRGQADGLDRAIKRSHGSFLLVLNSDDLLLPHAASWAVRHMAMYSAAAVVYGDLLLIDEQGEVTGQFVSPEYDFGRVLCVEKVIGAQAAWIRRSMLEVVGLGADPDLDTCPDYELFVRLGMKFPMRHVPGFVAKYRFIPRPMDGSAPRSVERFVAAKAAVQDRIFGDPKAFPTFRRLGTRARTGLYLWASQEARGTGDLRAAWTYYARALSTMSLVGKALAASIMFYLRRRRPRPKGAIYHSSPDLNLALRVGAGLIQDTPRLARFVGLIRRTLRNVRERALRAVVTLRSGGVVAAVILQLTLSLVLLVILSLLVTLLLQR
jgi:hypothetical protein